MTDAITARIDHVAVAVHSIDGALPFWRDRLGGGALPPFDGAGFRTRQLRYRDGGKLELLEPAGEDGFATSFLERHGEAVHHVTLKCDEFDPALDVVREAGFDVVGEDRSDPWWHEAFLRPSQTGGLVVQLAWTPESDEEWARRSGQTLEEPSEDAASLDAVVLGTTDLAAATSRWMRLGAAADTRADEVRLTWPQCHLAVVLRTAPSDGAVGLRFTRLPDGADSPLLLGT